MNTRSIPAEVPRPDASEPTVEARAANKPRGGSLTTRPTSGGSHAFPDSGLCSDSCHVFLDYCQLVPDRTMTVHIRPHGGLYRRMV